MKVFSNNPTLWMDLYGDGSPATPIDDNYVWFPATEDELENMAKEWEDAGWTADGAEQIG